MDSVLDVEVQKLDEDQPTKSFEDTDEGDTAIKHNAKESRVVEEAEKHGHKEGKRDDVGSEDDENDEDEMMLIEKEIERRKTYALESLNKTVDVIKALPFEKRFNEQGHVHQIIKQLFIDFNAAVNFMFDLPLEEIEAFCETISEQMVATGYYEFRCECLVRTLLFTTIEYLQREADNSELFSFIIISQSEILTFTDKSETLRTAVAKFPWYLDACRIFLEFFEGERKGFENLASSVS